MSSYHLDWECWCRRLACSLSAGQGLPCEVKYGMQPSRLTPWGSPGSPKALAPFGKALTMSDIGNLGFMEEQWDQSRQNLLRMTGEEAGSPHEALQVTQRR